MEGGSGIQKTEWNKAMTLILSPWAQVQSSGPAPGWSQATALPDCSPRVGEQALTLLSRAWDGCLEGPGEAASLP